MSFSPLRDPEQTTQDGCPASDEEDDVFHIPSKPSLEMLKKWRKPTLVLNATRRFRYTLDLNKEGPGSVVELKNGEHVTSLRTVTYALRAVQRFREAGQRYCEGPLPEGFGIGLTHLVRLMQNQDLVALEERAGVQGIARDLKTNLESGIADDVAVDKSRNAFGNNKIPSKPGKHFLVFVWEACHDTTLIILMACAIVSFGTGMGFDGPSQGWYDGVSIAVAVLLVIFVTASSDYRQSLQFCSLNEVKKDIQMEVVRGGRRCGISIFDIVVGDIVPINIGDRVPADGLLVSGQSLVIDESSMTGESVPVSKDDKHPFLLSGCKVSDGYGTMMVTAVGTNTEWGQVMTTITEDNGEETPLQVRLNGAATFIGQIGLSVAVLVFIILFIRFFVVDFKDNKQASKVILQIVNIFSIAVTIVVVAVPEGLPLAVTLTLAYSMRKMMADKSLVRHLAACETMGSATTICSDKTGTLTLNQMSVVKSWVFGQLMEPEAVKAVLHSHRETLLFGIYQNSNGNVFIPKDGGQPEVSGSPTESAALSWGVEIDRNVDYIRSKTSVMHVEAFNSTKKRAGVVLKVPGDRAQVHWKGAAEIILEKSSDWVDVDGSVKIMTQDKAAELTKYIEGMAAASLRCIAFAYREIEDISDIPEDKDDLKEWTSSSFGHLTFMAVIGIKDPCRPGVQEAVARCQAAGIKVRMVTGDSLLTATAIAQECGILTGGDVVEGRVFRNYSKEELDKKLQDIDVMARSSPSDKLLLVKALKQRGEVVAVTGDGTNDAPALQEADVGLSMGISGTEVAKESSDIVILDDNFASIVKVVRWGRSVYSNIQKFIQFQLTVNVTALVINFVSAISSGKVPLTAVQLLWVNLIMDTLGALALATEAPTDDLMEKTPVGRREPLITNIMWRNLLGQALYQITVLLTLDFGGKKILRLEDESDPERVNNTIIFNAFVFCQIFNEVNSRRQQQKNIFEGLHKNHLFIGIILIEIVGQFLIVQFLKNFATTTPLTVQQWAICIGIGVISWPLAFFLKFIPVHDKPYVDTRSIRLNWRKRSNSLKKTLSLSRSSCSRSREVEGSKSTGKKDRGFVAGDLPVQTHTPEVEFSSWADRNV